MNNSNYFNKALHDMVFENACGAAIKRLADKSFPISYIIKELDYPVSFERVQKYVWKYYLDNKILIYPENEKELDYETRCVDGNKIIIINKPRIKKTFVKEQGPYGKTTFRQVITDETVNSDNNDNNLTDIKYIACDFGILKYDNPDEFLRLLNRLDTEDRAYVMDMPWENKRIYHILEGRMTSIYTKLKSYTL